MIFVRGVFGGLIAVVFTWVIILWVDLWRLREANRQRGITGLGAVAGGWTFLLHMPVVIILLAAAFGLGLYLATR